MQIYSYTVGPFAENTYLLIQDNSAVIIDPGFSNGQEYEQVLQTLRAENAKLAAILLTHAHVDHLLGLSQVLDDYKVPVYLNENDQYLWENISSQAAMFGLQVDGFSFTPQPLKAQNDFSIGPFAFDILYTPGHSPDHVSLYSEQDEMLIAGDALFKEGIGRTDLYKGDMETLKSSISKKLYTLPDATVVYPGHGPQTSIKHEKAANPFVSVVG